MSGTAGPEQRGPERPGPDYPPEWDNEPDDECTCPSGDGSLRWPCPTHPPVTDVDRPDNGQDEGRRVLRMHAAAGSAWTADNLDAPLASGRAGAGEQQRHRIADELDRHAPNLGPRDSNQPATWFSWCDCGWDGGVYTEAYADAYRHHVADELLALLGGPQPDGEAPQHRMDADCPCQPVQADNGAWDHQ